MAELDQLSRTIGSLEATIKAHADDMTYIRGAVSAIKKDVSALKAFKWKATGIFTGVMTGFTIVGQFIIYKVRGSL